MKITNKYNLPKHVYTAIVEAFNEYDFEPSPFKISVTGLLSPPAIRQLTFKHNDKIEIDVTELDWAFFGTIGHRLLEQAEDGLSKEERNEIQVGRWTISGKYDVYDAEEKLLCDNKFVSSSVLLYSPNGKKEWHDQLNILRYICQQHGKQVDKLTNFVFVRDFNKNMAFKHNMPKSSMLSIPVPIYSDEAVLQLIMERLAYHEEYENKINIATCTEEERWSKKPTYAVRKIGGKMACAGGVKDSYLEAEEFMKSKNYTEKTHQIEFRPGADTRCAGYCSVNKFCPYWIEKQQNVQTIETNEDILPEW